MSEPTAHATVGGDGQEEDGHQRADVVSETRLRVRMQHKHRASRTRRHAQRLHVIQKLVEAGLLSGNREGGLCGKEDGADRQPLSVKQQGVIWKWLIDELNSGRRG